MNNRLKDNNVLYGIAILLICHALYIATTAILLAIWPIQSAIYWLVQNRELPVNDGGYIWFTFWAWSIIAICIAQAIYAIPLHRHFYNKRRYESAKGIAVGATITVILTGPCYLFGTLQ